MQSVVRAAVLGGVVLLLGCERERSFGKAVTQESDLVVKESLEAPAKPSSVAPLPAAEAPLNPVESEGSVEKPSAAPAPEPAVAEAPASPAREKAVAPARRSFAEVTPAQAERALREALELAAGKVIPSLKIKGGFNDQPDSRIPLPEDWRSMEEAVRKVGRGDSVEVCLSALNGVAERAVGELERDLYSLIATADLGDGKAALTASADGGVQAFLASAEERLNSAAVKAVEKAMAGSGVESALESLVVDARFANPFTNIRSVGEFDLAAYLSRQINERVLVGMAAQERALRTDPTKLNSETAASVFQAAQ